MRKRPTRPVCPSLCDRLPTECLSDAAHAHHGTRRGGELPRSVRSWISTSSWPKNPSRPITYLRQDLAKGQRQLRRVLGRLPSQRFDDVPELAGAQRDRLQVTSAVPRLPHTLSRRPLVEFAPAHRGNRSRCSRLNFAASWARLRSAPNRKSGGSRSKPAIAI